MWESKIVVSRVHGSLVRSHLICIHVQVLCKNCPKPFGSCSKPCQLHRFFFFFFFQIQLHFKTTFKNDTLNLCFHWWIKVLMEKSHHSINKLFVQAKSTRS